LGSEITVTTLLPGYIESEMTGEEAARRLVHQIREALASSSRPDFQVSKTSVRAWKLQAISSRARELVRHAALPGTSGCHGGECFADHRGVNDFAYYVRARGYTDELLGPQGLAALCFEPEAGYSFEHLKNAQALGDMKTLREHGLTVVRVELDGDPADAVRRIL
jgi:hypothetical protein